MAAANSSSSHLAGKSAPSSLPRSALPLPLLPLDPLSCSKRAQRSQNHINIKNLHFLLHPLTCPAATLLRGCAFLIETVMTSPMPQLRPDWLMHCATLAPELSVTWSCEPLEIIKAGKGRGESVRAGELFSHAAKKKKKRRRSERRDLLATQLRKKLDHHALHSLPPLPRLPGSPGLRLLRQRRGSHGQARRGAR